MDQRFHRLLHLGALGRRDLAVVRSNRARGHLRQALLHDPGRLAHFLDANHEPVIAIAAGADGNVEFHPVIDIVRLGLADVPRNAGTADHRAGEAPLDRIVLADRGDIDIALLEDAVVDHQAHRVFEQFGQARVEPGADIDQQLFRHVLVDAAGTEPGRVHPRTRSAFEEVEAVLADFEHPQVRRHRAHVHHVRTQVQHVVADAGQLGEQHAQVLRALRHLDVQQLLDRQHIGVLHAQRRAIVEPVKVRQRLEIGLVLDQLFGAAMQQADVRIDAFDHFAVQFQHHAQHAVRGRVLRAEVDRVIGDDIVAGGRRVFKLQAHWAAPAFSSPGSA